MYTYCVYFFLNYIVQFRLRIAEDHNTLFYYNLLFREIQLHDSFCWSLGLYMEFPIVSVLV